MTSEEFESLKKLCDRIDYEAREIFDLSLDSGIISSKSNNTLCDVTRLIKAASENIEIAKKLANNYLEKQTNNDKDSINRYLLTSTIIFNLPLIYEQIGDCMSKKDIKIINHKYNLNDISDHVGFTCCGKTYILGKGFTLDNLVDATLSLAYKVNKLKFMLAVSKTSTDRYVTFAHFGTVFTVLINGSNEPCIIKECSDLPDNIISLDYMIKLYNDKNSK